MNGKSIFKSKTFWFNLITFALTTQDLVPPKYAPVIGLAGNLALRLISSEPVSIIPR